MTQALSRRLKQPRFASPQQEALLSVIVAAGTINDLMDVVCERHGLTRSQYNVLRILRGVYPEGHPRCEIAQRMVERAPDVTRLVDRLQAQGIGPSKPGQQRSAASHHANHAQRPEAPGEYSARD